MQGEQERIYNAVNNFHPLRLKVEGCHYLLRHVGVHSVVGLPLFLGGVDVKSRPCPKVPAIFLSLYVTTSYNMGKINKGLITLRYDEH